ncbi:phosphatase PAP2 family protein [Mucilaginibacter sp. BT774]|uniref:phosphatase PAP2 family protein n=1 Tax=Mucilaginibacter sp. BT774 TaxID=3062276 RepID=UPI00267461BE|nr:phosphatase PAP2 family protein [Mucilaginibacter sp. BT774]MDO3628641.1 phosphatase PAP2 family protein [Mucilaginibacter sp. BT774]
MKRIIQNIATALLIAMIASSLLSCRKEVISRVNQYPALAPTNLDLNADTWRPVLVTDPTVFTVAAPDATTSPAYIADLNEIKGYQRSLTDDQRAIIKYWSAGAVLRWNEIMRDLVAKHNVPPYQNPDGSYPAPSSANPFNYPEFPFSNPPFAARAYAYLSAAEYDALIVAYHYKNQYNRSAPYKNDVTIQALIPKSDLPSYPSEDAVVAGAAVQIMKMMFPTEINYIEQKAEEEKQYRIMAGANTRGELNAGEALGIQVANVFTARARTDKAGTAGGNKTIWANLASKTIAKGETAWVSLETPKRPPMLPLFNKVSPFLFDTLTVVALRPGPPHSTGSPEFAADQKEVLYYSQHATRENEALVAFWADGVATYTPAGHWNAIAADEFVKQHYSEVRWARNFALLNMAEMDAAIVCWDTKYAYFNPRPSQVNSVVKTLTGVPNFPSYTSGHSNFSSAAATVLTYLLPDRGTKFTNLAQQASLSRLVGGIHTRQDIEVGQATGKAVGQYAVQRGQSDGAGIGN